jgi:beta-fructofuranosidase
VTFGFSEIDNPDSLKNYFGWTGKFGLPRSLWLGSNGTLRMRPVKELETLRMNESMVSNVKVSSGSEIKLDDLGNELMEL